MIMREMGTWVCSFHLWLVTSCIPHICRKYHKWDMWRKICHVEKFQIYMRDRCGEIWNSIHKWRNFKFILMTDVEKFEISLHLACVWCGECLYMCTGTFKWRKSNQRFHMLRKNDKYQVWRGGGEVCVTKSQVFQATALKKINRTKSQLLSIF